MIKKMRKIVCAIFAFAAGIVLATDGITSANIVGYQTKTMPSDWYIDVVNTFVNADGSAATLGKFNFTPVSDSINQGNFSIILTGTDGNPMKVGANKWIKETYPEAVTDYGTKDVIFVYIPAKGDVPSMWVLSADKAQANRKYDMSDYPFAAGEGFTIQVGTTLADGVNTTYSGQVLDADIPFAIPTDTYMNTGNAAPKDFTLGDFVFVPGSGAVNQGNMSVILTGQNGSPMKVKDCPWISTNFPDAVTDYGDNEVILVYVPANTKKATPAMWVLSADKGQSARKYDMSAFSFKAGDGFCVQVGTTLPDGVTVYLPNAMN